MTDVHAPAAPGRLTVPGPGAEPWLRGAAAAGLVVTLGAAAAVVTLATTLPPGRSAQFNSPVAVALQMVGMAGLALAGATLAHRRPREPIAWLMLGTAVAWAASALTMLGALALLDRGSALAPAAGWLTNWAWVPAQGLTLVMLLRFPTGLLPDRRWRVVEGAVLAWATVTALTTSVLPGPLGAEALAPLTNPLGLPALAAVADPVLDGLFLALPVLVVASCAGLVVRWRRADRRERRALRWLALAALVVAVSAPLALAGSVGEVLQGLAFLLLPVAVGTAVLREQLWDLDLRVRYDRLQAARERERERLRHELHDSLGPALGSLSMRAEAARNLMRRGETARAEEVLASIGTTTEAALTDLRRLIDDLGPSALLDADLSTALGEHLRAYADTFPVTLQVRPDPLPRLEKGVAATAYLLVTEAVRNAARHSGGTGAEAVLELDGEDLRVRVRDDGRGVVGTLPGVGRRGMQRRAEETGGRFSCTDAPGGGTVVSAVLTGAAR